MDLHMLENTSYDFNNNCIINDEFIIFKYNHFTFLNFIKVFLSLCSGTLLSVVFVSFFLYHPIKIKFEKLYEENKEIYEYDPFLISYLDELYDETVDDETVDDEYLKTLVNKYLYYNFDFRDKKYYIVMNYNFDNESFNYYLNGTSNVLPFDYLDTVSRIYCVKYNCKNIYIDNYDNKEKLFNSLNHLNDNDNDVDNDDNNNDLKNDIFYSRNKNSNMNKNSNQLVNYTSNKFKYMGLLKEFSDLLVDSDIYDGSNNLINSYQDLENEIFSVKKNHDFEVISQNDNKISFKFFKNMK